MINSVYLSENREAIAFITDSSPEHMVIINAGTRDDQVCTAHVVHLHGLDGETVVDFGQQLYPAESLPSVGTALRNGFMTATDGMSAVRGGIEYSARPVRVALLARYSWHADMIRVGALFRAAGFEITSTWLYEQGVDGVDTRQLNRAPEQHEMLAQNSITDIAHADIVVVFTSAGSGLGGREAEFGAAAALGKRIILIGNREHLHHALPQVEQFPTWQLAAAALNVPIPERVQFNGPVHSGESAPERCAHDDGHGGECAP
jgi:hypothetical protein